MKRFFVILLAMTLLMMSANAESAVGASIRVRASRDVRDSVIRTGEDVDISVTVSGFEPMAYIWYFNGEVLSGDNTALLHISHADDSRTGTYRMDAVDSEGRVRVSVDTALRVVNVTEIPKTGDTRLPKTAAAASALLTALTAAVLVILRKNRRNACFTK